MRLHHGAAGDSGGFVHAVREVTAWLAAVRGRKLLDVLEYFGCADDRSMFVVNRNGMNADRDLVPDLVMKQTGGLRRLGRFHGERNRAFFAAEFTPWLVAVQERLSYARVANDFMTQVPGDAFGTITPKDDPLFEVNDTKSGG